MNLSKYLTQLSDGDHLVFYDLLDVLGDAEDAIDTVIHGQWYYSDYPRKFYESEGHALAETLINNYVYEDEDGETNVNPIDIQDECNTYLDQGEWTAYNVGSDYLFVANF